MLSIAESMSQHLALIQRDEKIWKLNKFDEKKFNDNFYVLCHLRNERGEQIVDLQSFVKSKSQTKELMSSIGSITSAPETKSHSKINANSVPPSEHSKGDNKPASSGGNKSFGIKTQTSIVNYNDGKELSTPVEIGSPIPRGSIRNAVNEQRN